MWLFQVLGVAESTLDPKLIDYLWATWSPGWNPGEHRERVHALYADPALAANALRIYRANFDTSLHDPHFADLAPTGEAPASVPMLVLAGAEDGCMPPSTCADAETGLAPDSRVETVAGAGHFMHLDRPDEVARIILEWLQ